MDECAGRLSGSKLRDCHDMSGGDHNDTIENRADLQFSLDGRGFREECVIVSGYLESGSRSARGRALGWSWFTVKYRILVWPGGMDLGRRSASKRLIGTLRS